MARKQTPLPLPARGAAFLMPLADGRLGVCRVLRGVQGLGEAGEGGQQHSVLVAAAPWIGSEPPALDEPRLREILILTHHSWCNSPQVLWVGEAIPAAFQELGVIEPLGDEERLQCLSYGSWEGFALQVLMQWRWDNDRAAVLREDEEEQRLQVLARAKAKRNRSEQLAALTLDRLQKKPRFGSWNGQVSQKPLRETRRVFRDTVNALIALGPQPRARDTLRILRSCIVSLNELDEEHEFIMTIEREDLCEEFEEVVHASGLGAHNNLADRWRNW